MAGGTDLLVQLRSGIFEPEVVVDLKKIDETQQISQEDGAFRVGASVSGATLGDHAALKAAYPGVVEAAELIGSTQIQGRASYNFRGERGALVERWGPWIEAEGFWDRDDFWGGQGWQESQVEHVVGLVEHQHLDGV